MHGADSTGLPLAALGDAAVLPSGTRLDGFRLEAMIAQGGFGQVYRATEVDSGRVVAVKVLHGELCGAPSAVARFLREAEVTVRVRHPHVVELVSWGTVADGRPYLVMEFLTGTDLGRVLAQHGRLSIERTLAIVAPICAALTAAHAQAVVHRDVKVGNVFLAQGPDGVERVVLIDFGIAKLAAPEAAELTTSRQLVGTPVTMAPEQIAGGAVDARTDVYGLGVMTFHLLTGRLPFEDESATIVQYLHAHARRPRASAFAPVPTELDDVLARAMAIDPAQRYPGADAFAAALRDAVATPSASADELEPRPAVAILVEVRADDDAMADPDDALLADLEGLLPLAERHLASAGFAMALHSGNLLLAGHAIDGDDATARAAAIDVARVLAAELEVRPARDARVGFVVVVHAGVALCAGTAVRAGELTDVAYWTPDPSVRGLVATRAALDGLPVLSAAVSDSRVWQVR
ncbi:MAG: serine/threonine protein kinase [Myxococcales bacterium]|nr:serine/threonine protein kinase [Myxococcales bacterium]